MNLRTRKRFGGVLALVAGLGLVTIVAAACGGGGEEASPTPAVPGTQAAGGPPAFLGALIWKKRRVGCHRRAPRVPLSAGSPVSRDPPAGAETVLRATCRGSRARVVQAPASGGAPECPNLSGEGGETFRVARCGSLSRGRNALHAR